MCTSACLIWALDKVTSVNDMFVATEEHSTGNKTSILLTINTSMCFLLQMWHGGSPPYGNLFRKKKKKKKERTLS